MKTVQTPGEVEVAKCAEKKKQLLAANKAAARLLLLSVMSDSTYVSRKTQDDWNTL